MAVWFGFHIFYSHSFALIMHGKNLNVMKFRHGTHSRLSHITIPEVVSCNDVRCNDEQHRHHIDMYYESICKVLTSVAKLAFPTTNLNIHKIT